MIRPEDLINDVYVQDYLGDCYLATCANADYTPEDVKQELMDEKYMLDMGCERAMTEDEAQEVANAYEEMLENGDLV